MRTTPTVWNGREVRAADPEPIADRRYRWSEPTVRATEGAMADLRVTGGLAVGPLEVAARLMLRSEGVASSAIEGLTVPAVRIALSQAQAGPADPVAEWVAANLAVLTGALADRDDLDRPMLWSWHRRLMAGSGLPPDQIGAWRSTLGWIGGVNPLVAAHVAPPAEFVDAAMEDLCAFTRRRDLDPVTRAAVLHAQFETIHPFADGNGRLGRVLVSRELAHGADIHVPPPVSLVMSRDIGGYLSGLRRFQEGEVDAWVRWFAGTVSAAAVRSRDVLTQIDELTTTWRHATNGLRRDAAAHQVLDLLVDHPVLSVALVVELLQVSSPTARSALTTLTELGVLDDLGPIATGPGHPANWWAATALLDLVGR